MVALENDGFGETGKEKPLNGITPPSQVENGNTKENPSRIDLKLELWADFKELGAIRKALAENRKQVSRSLTYQVHTMQVRSQIAKTIFFGMKDAELDELAAEIEEIKVHVNMVKKE